MPTIPPGNNAGKSSQLHKLPLPSPRQSSAQPCSPCAAPAWQPAPAPPQLCGGPAPPGACRQGAQPRDVSTQVQARGDIILWCAQPCAAQPHPCRAAGPTSSSAAQHRVAIHPYTRHQLRRCSGPRQHSAWQQHGSTSSMGPWSAWSAWGHPDPPALTCGWPQQPCCHPPS